MKATTQTTPTKEVALEAKNQAVTASYFAIITDVKDFIKRYPTDYLRTLIEIDYNSIGLSTKHGFYSPLIHLQLEEHEGQNFISFARNFNFKQQIGNHLDSLLTRCVYKHTAEAYTSIFIEDALNVTLYNVDDFRQAMLLLDKGFKDCKKITIEQLQKGA